MPSLLDLCQTAQRARLALERARGDLTPDLTRGVRAVAAGLACRTATCPVEGGTP